VSHLLRPGHLQQLNNILRDPEASANDRFVALDLLKNANIAAGGVLPMCQDTGTAIVFGKKGQRVWVEGDEEEALSYGVHRTYTETNLRYSQMAPLTMWDERNTGQQPAGRVLHHGPRQATTTRRAAPDVRAEGRRQREQDLPVPADPRVLSTDKLLAFLSDRIKSLGTSACPPYHLAIVIGGTSAEATLKTGSCLHALARHLPTGGSPAGHAFRDVEFEREVHRQTQNLGTGRSSAASISATTCAWCACRGTAPSLPIGIGVSCSADRQIKAKVTAEGVFLEEFGARSGPLPARSHGRSAGRRGGAAGPEPAHGRHPRRTVAPPGEDALVAHRHGGGGARHRARQAAGAVDRGEGLPDYIKDHPVYYAGPAKTPEGYATGSFGPTTAGRMDSYVAAFQAAGGSLVMWPRATAPRRCASRAASTAASTWARSAAPRRGWRRTASARSRCWNTRNSAWKPFGASRWRTSRPSSWWTTRGTTSTTGLE
jgi:fumarate hydratase class I